MLVTMFHSLFPVRCGGSDPCLTGGRAGDGEQRTALGRPGPVGSPPGAACGASAHRRLTGNDAQLLERISASVVQEALQGYPLLTFRPEEFRFGFKVQGITIGADEVRVKFE